MTTNYFDRDDVYTDTDDKPLLATNDLFCDLTRDFTSIMLSLLENQERRATFDRKFGSPPLSTEEAGESLKFFAALMDLEASQSFQENLDLNALNISKADAQKLRSPETASALSAETQDPHFQDELRKRYVEQIAHRLVIVWCDYILSVSEEADSMTLSSELVCDGKGVLEFSHDIEEFSDEEVRQILSLYREKIFAKTDTVSLTRGRSLHICPTGGVTLSHISAT